MPMKITRWLQQRVMSPLVGRMDVWEERVAAMPGVHKAVPGAPMRFEIMKEGLKRGKTGMEPELTTIMPPILLGMRTSMLSLHKNPSRPKVRVTEGFLKELEAFARALGVSSIGYAHVPAQWIFQGKAILHINAIMLTMEMDKGRIATAPSIPCKQAVMEVYRDLGIVANKLATYLRKRGYSADAGHPLMGPALYPPLAQLAGLGWLGASGLIITPEHGPRVRLAAVFTSIENLPFSTRNDYAWIEEFCAKCGNCRRKCPADAILPAPLQHASGRITCVDSTRCFPYFNDYHGCSVCIKVCPFNTTPYQKIKQAFLKSQRRTT
jgi:NAD-dependent dihydropyrimidine dehydrogenase PreA subunit